MFFTLVFHSEANPVAVFHPRNSGLEEPCLRILIVRFKVLGSFRVTSAHQVRPTEASKKQDKQQQQQKLSMV